ncbi:c-type cytochrome [Chelativorans sp. YIM 93263]|uniref:c-type cytochrome n=1 Tax=Chelativorans sp. YIM 93263 TaxID=2906648 RepID=UPI002378F5D7|nr:c-type cytochrome [Chelativorans sp. YIM 93263]
MTPKKRASVRIYVISALGLALAACDQPGDTAETEPQIDPLATMREQAAADRTETPGPTEIAQATDSSEPGEPGDGGEPVQLTEPAGSDAPAAPEEPGEPQQAQSPAGTFTPRVEEEEGIWEGRLPTGDGRSILIPATTLFPGMARVDPHIENPYSGDTDAIAAGERHFAAYNCAGCHAPLGGGGMGPPLSDNDWIYGGEPAQIYLSIMHGRGNGMPAWASMLPRKTAWEMVAYIGTLSEIEDYAAELGFEEGGRYEQPDDSGEEQQPDTGTDAGGG